MVAALARSESGSWRSPSSGSAARSWGTLRLVHCLCVAGRPSALWLTWLEVVGQRLMGMAVQLASVGHRKAACWAVGRGSLAAPTEVSSEPFLYLNFKCKSRGGLRAAGKAGVALSTLGPGATNMTTSAAYAQLGGFPTLLITGAGPHA